MQLIHISTCLLVNRAGADARTVRPYMPKSMQFIHMSTCLLVNRAGANARTVRPYNLGMAIFVLQPLLRCHTFCVFSGFRETGIRPQ